MDKNEYDLAKLNIIKQYGVAEWDMGDAVNPSAKKLVELRHAYSRNKAEIVRTKKLAEQIKELTPVVNSSSMTVPEELIKQEWLVSFNDEQRKIIMQWSRNIKQTPKQIADIVDSSMFTVKHTLNLEAFKHLRIHLQNAHKDLLPLEASIALRECLHSPTENVRFNALKMVLIEAGLYRAENSEATNRPERVLDKETEKKLKELGDRVLGIKFPKAEG